MKTSHKILLIGFILLFIYGGVKFSIGQYQSYVYNKNEEKGFCTAEQKYLTDEEKLNNLRADLVVIALEGWTKHTDRNKFSRIMISKYDLNDKEKIIELMAKSDINKSFEENFGVIAIGTVREYIDRRTCLREPRRCYDFSKSRNELRGLWKEDNSIDMDYLRGLDKDYSIIIDESYAGVMAYIYPLSNITKTGKNSYQTSSYFIDKFCCDRESIEAKVGTTNSSNQKKTAEQIQQDYQDISELRLDEIDGESRDSIYILDLFDHLKLDNPELVQKYGLFLSAGSLRRNFKPFPILVTACGKISEQEQPLNSGETQSGYDSSLLKRRK